MERHLIFPIVILQEFLEHKALAKIGCLNFIFFILFQMHRSYTHHRSSSETHDSIEELRNAFELAERSSPGITEHFIQLIFTRLHPNGSEDRARSYVDRLTRVTKS